MKTTNPLDLPATRRELIEVRQELKADIHRLEQKISVVQDDIIMIKVEIKELKEMITEGIQSILKAVGPQFDEHGRRIARLEKRVFS